MKELLAGIVLVLVIGVGAFLYRNALEHPITTAPGPVACTEDAKICPDGSSVGRTGPTCAFAPCLPPNVEIPAIHIGFVLPIGYVENKKDISPDTSLIDAYTRQEQKTTTSHQFLIRDFPIPVGKSATSTVLTQTVYGASGEPAKSLSEFKTETIGGKTFYVVVLERFEGQIHSAYYLPRTDDVLRFEVIERGVDWTNPKLVIESLPEHKALLALLATLQSQ